MCYVIADLLEKFVNAGDMATLENVVAYYEAWLHAKKL